MSSAPKILVETKNLSTHFPIYGGLMRKKVGAVQAVNDVNIQILEGETLGIVGESGCGKSTLGRTICRLYEPTSGKIHFTDQDITHMERSELKPIRRHMQMIFQDPYASLNPRLTVERILEEPYKLHKIGKPSEHRDMIASLMVSVGLRPDAMMRYPHEFSGGQRQRIGIARAIALEPKLVICDEAVSALDVSIQSQVLNLLVELQKKLKLTYLFISHDLSVIRYISDRIAVMYLGQIVEIGDRDDIYGKSMHPYTRALLEALPIPDPRKRKTQAPLEGDVPSPASPPSGCRFHTRCPFAKEQCRTSIPALKQIANNNPHHLVACHFAGDI
jgi:oligopeptide transport system ATP-binding protein